MIYLFWHWTCSIQPSSITRTAVTCTSNKVQSHGWIWLLQWCGTSWSLSGLRHIQTPFVHDRSHKDLSVLALRENALSNIHAPCLEYLPSSAYSISRQLPVHKPCPLQVNVPPRMDRLSRTATEAHTKSPARRTTASVHTLTLAQAPRI
jgi:hypothetical protein